MASRLQVELGEINAANLEQLRTLNVATFPVRYNNQFYSNVLLTPPEYTKYGVFLCLLVIGRCFAVR